MTFEHGDKQTVSDKESDQPWFKRYVSATTETTMTVDRSWFADLQAHQIKMANDAKNMRTTIARQSAEIGQLRKLVRKLQGIT